MYKMCTRRVVSVCVAWSAYIKEKTTHILCVLYILAMCLFINEQRILTGFEPTSLQWYLYVSNKSSIRIADIAQTRFPCLCLNEIGTTEVDKNLSQNCFLLSIP